MLEQLTRLSNIECLELYLEFIKNKQNYSPQDRLALEQFFEDG